MKCGECNKWLSRISAKIGESGLNILNMDAQEETSRIIIVIEDTQDNISKSHQSNTSGSLKDRFCIM